MRVLRAGRWVGLNKEENRLELGPKRQRSDQLEAMDAKNEEAREETRSTHVRMRESRFSRCWTMRATISHEGIRLDERLRPRLSEEREEGMVSLVSSSTSLLLLLLSSLPFLPTQLRP